MSNLRNKIIRLAHQKPELREHLLPLVKEASKGQAKSVIQSILKSLDLSNTKAQNVSLDGGDEYILVLEDYVDSVRYSPQWEAFLESQYKTEFKKAYKLLSNAYSRDKIKVFQETFPRSKFFQNVGSTKTSKYALAIVKTMKEILRSKKSWEFGVMFDDFVKYWQGDAAGKATVADSFFGFRQDVQWLGAEKNYTDLIRQETKRYLDSLG